MKRRHFQTLALVLLGVLFCIGTATAQPAPPLSDFVDVTIGGVSVPGYPFSFFEVAAEGALTPLPPVPNLFGIAPGLVAVYLTDPFPIDPALPLSDILVANANPTAILFTFASDPPESFAACPPIGLPVGPCIPETGAPQDVTVALFGGIPSSLTGLGELHVIVFSDVEQRVPFPATVLLLASGAAALALRRKVRFA